MQYDILCFIQGFSSDFSDAFFLAVTRIGEAYIPVAAVLILYWCVNKDFGKTLFYAVLFSLCVNVSLKNIIKLPRPDISSGIRQYKQYNDFSFPSGHTQNASVTLVTLSAYSRKKPLYLLSAVLIFAVALSRLYLGVHFPADVLCGFAVGAGVAMFSVFAYRKFGSGAEGKTAKTAFALNISTLAAVTALALVSSSGEALSYCALFAGYTAGDAAERRFVRFETAGLSVIKKITRALIGSLLIFAEYMLISLLLPDGDLVFSFMCFILSFTAAGLYPAAFRRLRLI